MMHMYLFNPDHDMALANFTPYYKTTSEIIRMANELSTLPAWYADKKGDWVKTDKLQRGERLVEQCRKIGIALDVHWCTEYLSIPYKVWGWNPALVHAMKESGVEEKLLPTEGQLQKIRYLSGRQRCREILAHFSSLSYACGKSELCYSIEDVKSFIKEYGKTVLKAPWSGSGRGVTYVSLDSWSDSVEGWISRIIRTQGTIVAEPYYNKVVDFAMEFYVDSEISFAGYSLFETDTHGNYKENLLLSNEEIERRLTTYLPQSVLYDVQKELMETLFTLCSKDYKGYLGVDMMICKEGGEYLIHPCVEINLRMNMGVISRIIFDRYVHPSTHGRYIVEHYTADGLALEKHQKMTEQYPLYMKKGRICRGYLSLTPVFTDTRYQVYILLADSSFL